MIFVAEEIAALKGMDTKEVIRVLTENARKMYRL